MISKNNKFPMRVEFVQFRSSAKRLSLPHATVYFSPTAKTSRLSIVVPAKVSGLAVVRNWLKRLVYDNLWSTIEEKKIDCVVIFKPIPLSRSLAVKEQIISELKSLNV